MKRYKHSLSHYHLTTFDMGELVPVANFEVLPGDTIRMATSALIRVSPLLTPVMHPVTVRIHHWFVPYRVMWPGPPGWEDFITGGPDGTFGGTYPSHPASGVAPAGSLGNYLGIPLNTNPALTVAKFPFMAYNMIYNEHYRDEDLCPLVNVDLDVGLKKIAWEKDRFTSARPWTQKGPAVTIPLGQSAPVRAASGDIVTADTNAMRMRRVDGVTQAAQTPYQAGGGISSEVFAGASSSAIANGTRVFPSNLYADLATASAATVNQWRFAMAVQRYQEARAQYGDRYPEYLAYLGVRSSDGRLDRPEYLGGGKTTISFSEVLRTGDGGTPSASNPIGDLNGHGIAAMRSRSFVRFFEEHGVVLSLASVRPRSIYVNGLHKQWSRRSKENYWQKELERVGQEEIFNREVYAPGATPEGVFGYQDRYSDYRHFPSYITGDFADTTMSDWHFGRMFGAQPALNQAFVECVPGKRPMAEQTKDSLWCMFNHSIQARRLVGHGGKPGKVE